VHLLSQALLDLHRSTRDVSPSEFQRQALDLLKPLIPFDAAAWPTGAIVAGEVVVHTVHLAGVQPNFIETWERHKHEDHLVQRVMTNPGKAFKVCVRKEFAGTQILRHHCRPNRMEQILCTSELDALTGLYNVVALYRSDPDDPFTERERRLFQVVGPHLAEAWTTNRIEYLKRTSTPASSGRWSSGIADGQGVLHVMDHHFVERMLLEWPAWKGARLPREVRALSAGTSVFSGRRITVKARQIDGFILFDVRLRSELDNLSPREMDIAKRFADGKSYKQVAAELDISPATVRTHLATIYNKARVKNKVELIELVRQ
jgi:DNA-binding CsgD family transcriptional regulator